MRKRKRRYKSLDKYEMLLYPERLEALRFNQYDHDASDLGNIESSENDELAHVEKAFVIALAKLNYFKEKRMYKFDLNSFSLLVTALDEYFRTIHRLVLSSDDIMYIGHHVVQSFVKFVDWGSSAPSSQVHRYCTSFIYRYNYYEEIKDVVGQFFSLFLDKIAEKCETGYSPNDLSRIPNRLGHIAVDVLKDLKDQSNGQMSFKYNCVRYEDMIYALMVHIFIKLGGSYRLWKTTEMMEKFGFQLNETNISMLVDND